MFWWKNPKEETFEATSGITVAVVETGDNAYYRVAPRHDTSQHGQVDSSQARGKET